MQGSQRSQNIFVVSCGVNGLGNSPISLRSTCSGMVSGNKRMVAAIDPTEGNGRSRGERRHSDCDKPFCHRKIFQSLPSTSEPRNCLERWLEGKW